MNPGQRLDQATRWPYSPWVYARRALWRVTWLTVWQLCWKRFYTLRAGLIRMFGGRTARYVNLARTAWIEMPWQITLGDYVAIGSHVVLYNLGELTIGDHTVLSQDVYVCGGTHDYTDPRLPLLRKPITIGSHVWIGAGAFIGPGVNVGDGCVIGARAVIVKDVDPWTVVAGNPARFIRRREMKSHIFET
jgi:putative colanic acid biosynthesis acetyltransferase WcaF